MPSAVQAGGEAVQRLQPVFHCAETEDHLRPSGTGSWRKASTEGKYPTVVIGIRPSTPLNVSVISAGAVSCRVEYDMRTPGGFNSGKDCTVP